MGVSGVSRGCAAVGLCGLLLAILSPCFAAEGGIGVYWPGYRNYTAGIVPARPGLYIRNDLVYYTATAPRVVLNGLPIENISVDIAAELIEPIYVFPWKLFGANHAALITQPLLWVSQSGGIIGTPLRPSGRRLGFGDTAVSPLYLGWHRGKVHYNTNLVIFVPNGSYDIHKVVNTSKNHWAMDPEFGITYLDPKTGWDYSAAIGYTFNFENEDTHYRSGQALHLDYAVGRTLRNGLKPGVAGYAWVQTTDDSGSGALFGSFRSQVLGIGPILQWQTGRSSRMLFRYYHEFGAANRLEGDQLVLQIRAEL